MAKIKPGNQPADTERYQELLQFVNDSNKAMAQIVNIVVPYSYEKFARDVTDMLVIDHVPEEIFRIVDNEGFNAFVIYLFSTLKTNGDEFVKKFPQYDSEEYLYFLETIAHQIATYFLKLKSIPVDAKNKATGHVLEQLNVMMGSYGNVEEIPAYSKLKSTIDKQLFDASAVENETRKKAKIDGMYYWPHDKVKLDQLYQLLIDYKMIEPCATGTECFYRYDVNPGLKIKFLKGKAKAMGLLYFILNEEHYYDGEFIPAIAIKLFDFNQKGDIKSANYTYNGMQSKFKDRAYLRRVHAETVAILKDLELL